MKKYHSGYYLAISNCDSVDDYSEKLIEESNLKLIRSNYSCDDWYIDWIYNSKWNGLEFIINAESFEIAQNILFNVLCAAAVIEGTVMWSNEAHYPHEFGTIDEVKGHEFTYKPVKAFSNLSIPYYFHLAILANKDIQLANSIVKYQLSTEIYSQHYMDLHEVIDWKKTDFNYIQMRFAYAIITAYSVIEELGLEIRASKEKPSRLKDGYWNPIVKDDLTRRLKSSNIQVSEDISWMIRGDATSIESKKSIKTSRTAEWADLSGYKNEFFISINDGYVSLHDAIDYISYLRSKISSHRVGDRIMDLSVFDVANAQHLVRRLILEKVGQWK